MRRRRPARTIHFTCNTCGWAGRRGAQLRLCPDCGRQTIRRQTGLT